MSDQTCEGYTNWHTWIIALYSDNYPAHYDYKQRLFRSFVDANMQIVTAKEARKIAVGSGLVRSCRIEEHEFDSRLVDWTDIADSWTTELEEFKRYDTKP